MHSIVCGTGTPDDTKKNEPQPYDGDDGWGDWEEEAPELDWNGPPPRNPVAWGGGGHNPDNRGFLAS